MEGSAFPALREAVAANTEYSDAYRFGDFRVVPQEWKLYREGRELHVEPTVLRLLVYLITHRDRLVTRQELMDTVWGDTVISEAALSKAVGRLRKALGDQAAAPRYIETVHSLGYRFIAEVEVPGAASATDTSKARAGPSSRLRFTAVLAVLVLLAVMLVVRWPREPQPPPPPGGEITTVAVLPLANLTGDPEEGPFVDGLHDVLVTELSRFDRLRVISRRSTIRYRDSDEPMPVIAAELGVDALVEGSVMRVDDRLRLTAQFIDGRSDEHLWARSYERDERDILGLVAATAAAIAATTRPVKEDATIEPPPVEPLDPAASRAYLEGLYHLNRFSTDSYRRAIDRFQQVVELEPGFAMGWGNLAAGHLMLAYYGGVEPREGVLRARAAALKALELDDGLYIGHAALGWVRLMTWDWPGAEQAFGEALRLNPSDAMTLHGEADCLMLTGRMDESLERVRRAQRLDPFTPMSSMPLPVHLFMARRYDEAIEEIQELRERMPAYPAHWLLSLIHWQQGDYDAALRAEREDLERRKDIELLAALERGLTDAGPQGALRALAEAQVERAGFTYVDPFRIAMSFARAGDPEATIAWLSRAVDRGSLELTYLGQWPQFDLVRGDPRYAELLERMGLPTN